MMYTEVPPAGALKNAGAVCIKDSAASGVRLFTASYIVLHILQTYSSAWASERITNWKYNDLRLS